MNRQPKDRRLSRRSGSLDRRGRQQVRFRPNRFKAMNIAKGRRLWRANAPQL